MNRDRQTFELAPESATAPGSDPIHPRFELDEPDIPTTLSSFLELVEQQLIAALERSRSGLDERTLTAAAVGWFRGRGVDHDPLAMFYWIARARGINPDPHHARLAAAAALAYVANEIERNPSEGPWALARPLARQACARGLLRMASRLAQGEPSCAELLDAHAQILAGDQRPQASSSPPALELVCTCAALAAGADDDAIDAFAAAGDATARIHWWLDELRRLLRPLDRAAFEARRNGPALRLFAEVSSFEQREELLELLDDLPHSSACLHEFLYRSGLVGRCAETIELARREVHAQLASVPCNPTQQLQAGLRNWLVAVDGLASNLYRVPELASSAGMSEARGPWTQLLRACLEDLDDRLARSPTAQPLPRLRFRAWGGLDWVYDPMRGVVLYPDLDGQPEELIPALAERLATDPDEVAQVLESLVPLFLVYEAVHAWRDAAGLRSPGRPGDEAWAAARITIAYLQRFEPAVLSVAQRVADHALAAHVDSLGSNERGLIEAALDADEPDTVDTALLDTLVERPLPASMHGSGSTALVQLALMRELLLHRLDLDAELARFVFAPRAAVGEPAANEPPESAPARLIRGRREHPALALRSRAWAGGISAACEQALIELCQPIHWRRSVRAVLARGGGELIDLWAELADELDFEFAEGSLRGAVNYVQYCTFGLVADRIAHRYLDPREAPQIQAALSNLVEHLHGHCEVEPDDRVEATRLLAQAQAALWRETRGELVDLASWWAIAESLAGDQYAAYFVRFASGVIASERAAAIGRGLGVLTHLGAALDRDDPRLVRLGPAAIASLVERAVAHAQPLLDTQAPTAVRRRGTGLITRLRSVL